MYLEGCELVVHFTVQLCNPLNSRNRLVGLDNEVPVFLTQLVSIVLVINVVGQTVVQLDSSGGLTCFTLKWYKDLLLSWCVWHMLAVCVRSVVEM